MEHRNISLIAREIQKDWVKISPYAQPYLEAMFSLNKVTDNYIYDSGKSIILYFLANAGSWRGEKAREIKKELKQIVDL
jgi:hypothetical protein